MAPQPDALAAFTPTQPTAAPSTGLEGRLPPLRRVSHRQRLRSIQPDQAERHLRTEIANGHTYRASDLAKLLEEQDRTDEAEQLYREPAATGLARPAPLLAPIGDAGTTQLAVFLDRRGRPGEAEQVLSAAAALGHWHVREPLITLLRCQGRNDEADAIIGSERVAVIAGAADSSA